MLLVSVGACERQHRVKHSCVAREGAESADGGLGTGATFSGAVGSMYLTCRSPVTAGARCSKARAASLSPTHARRRDEERLLRPAAGEGGGAHLIARGSDEKASSRASSREYRAKVTTSSPRAKSGPGTGYRGSGSGTTAPWQPSST